MALIEYSKPLRWEVADATALAAQTISENEIGFLCRQVDTSQIWKAIKAGSGAANWRLDMSDYRDGVTVVTLTDASSIVWDASQGNIYQVTLAGNHTLAAPMLTEIGKIYYLKVLQDASGNRTLAYNAVYHAAGGAITVTATAAHWDWLRMTALAANIFLLEQIADVSALA
jgi:S-adenosylmethionine:tRNA-ribosyltransferase-isomerase (queuine synthetase)